MTGFVPTVTMPDDDRNRADIYRPSTTGVPMDSDEYRPIEETRRMADVRSPLTRDFVLPAVMDEVLGRESATCEACQETVHHPVGGDLGDGEPFVLRELVENVYTVENQVLLCKMCANRPADEWRADVRVKRFQERDYTPAWDDYLAYWLSDPTATSLFARRTAVIVTGLIALLVMVAAVAGITGSLIADLGTGEAWVQTVLTTVAAVGSALVAAPWIVGSLVGIGYTAHAVERVRYDPRGYLTRDYQPWVRLAAGGVTTGIGALSLIGIATGVLSATPLVQFLAAAIWVSGAIGVAWYIDLAIRHDLAVGIWTPDRGVWMIAGRVGLLPGLLAITVGVPFPSVSDPTTTGVLTAIPASVALVFVGLRLPYDPQARDAILEVLPEWLLTVLTDSHRRE